MTATKTSGRVSKTSEETTISSTPRASRPTVAWKMRSKHADKAKTRSDDKLTRSNSAKSSISGTSSSRVVLNGKPDSSTRKEKGQSEKQSSVTSRKMQQKSVRSKSEAGSRGDAISRTSVGAKGGQVRSKSQQSKNRKLTRTNSLALTSTSDKGTERSRASVRGDEPKTSKNRKSGQQREQKSSSARSKASKSSQSRSKGGKSKEKKKKLVLIDGGIYTRPISQ
ncbi:uncharacterized protein LOC142342112 isoform X2 [Convolutriloba macropyga]|uniref:uncharacterized protein LOC142342112 isoform X2 n=1 Tax=Convolutriloba macropyga TaxID=536237 RepID=UPI003F5285D3